MTNDAINTWIEKAKQADLSTEHQSGIQVVRNKPKKTRGNLIMEIAELVRPHLAKMFEGVRDENGMLVQPSRVRGVALNLAQRIVKEHEQKASA
jgi:hypothetical protein